MKRTLLPTFIFFLALSLAAASETTPAHAQIPLVKSTEVGISETVGHAIGEALEQSVGSLPELQRTEEVDTRQDTTEAPAERNILQEVLFMLGFLALFAFYTVFLFLVITFPVWSKRKKRKLDDD